MLALDFRPANRIEVAKEKVKQFISRRTSDRIGIVAFAGEALTQVPLTTDYPVVMQAVTNLQAGQLEDGTAIGTAIATAANRLRDAPGKSRVMIILTDGVNNRGSVDPLDRGEGGRCLRNQDLWNWGRQRRHGARSCRAECRGWSELRVPACSNR